MIVTSTACVGEITTVLRPENHFKSNKQSNKQSKNRLFIYSQLILIIPGSESIINAVILVTVHGEVCGLKPQIMKEIHIL